MDSDAISRFEAAKKRDTFKYNTKLIGEQKSLSAPFLMAID